MSYTHCIYASLNSRLARKTWNKSTKPIRKSNRSSWKWNRADIFIQIYTGNNLMWYHVNESAKLITFIQLLLFLTTYKPIQLSRNIWVVNNFCFHFELCHWAQHTDNKLLVYIRFYPSFSFTWHSNAAKTNKTFCYVAMGNWKGFFFMENTTAIYIHIL